MKNSNDLKEHYNELKDDVQAYKQSLYKDYPQVAKFERRKQTFIKILLLLLFIYFILRIYTIQSVMDSNIFLLAISTFIKVDWIFLFAAMSPRWQLSFLLFIMALNNGWEVFSSFSNVGISSLGDFIQVYFAALQQSPFAAASDILMIIYIIATFIIAAWLTLPPQNRKYAEQSEALNLKIRDYTASLSNTENK